MSLDDISRREVCLHSVIALRRRLIARLSGAIDEQRDKLRGDQEALCDLERERDALEHGGSDEPA